MASVFRSPSCSIIAWSFDRKLSVLVSEAARFTRKKPVSRLCPGFRGAGLIHLPMGTAPPGRPTALAAYGKTRDSDHLPSSMNLSSRWRMSIGFPPYHGRSSIVRLPPGVPPPFRKTPESLGSHAYFGGINKASSSTE